MAGETAQAVHFEVAALRDGFGERQWRVVFFCFGFGFERRHGGPPPWGAVESTGGYESFPGKSLDRRDLEGRSRKQRSYGAGRGLRRCSSTSRMTYREGILTGATGSGFAVERRR